MRPSMLAHTVCATVLGCGALMSADMIGDAPPGATIRLVCIGLTVATGLAVFLIFYRVSGDL